MILLAASIAFYSVAGLRDSLLAATIIFVNYAFQFPVRRDARWLWPALALNFGCLIYFKYRVFLSTAAGLDFYERGIVIPLGISFYVFQLSAFLIDIGRGKAEPFTSFARFALFKLFFGQLIAGPIMRWRVFGPQINRLFDGKLPRPRFIGIGLGLCVLGLVKKVVFADSLAPFVDDFFREGPANALAAWVGAWLFGFQIYFDFSGYSDMALGIAFLFGLRLTTNFRQPYLARTPQMFWQHWHITLSMWIRDYLYIPLGGGKGSFGRQACVLIVVMALAGLWHGANWTFLIWGVTWALAILAVAAGRGSPRRPWRRRVGADARHRHAALGFLSRAGSAIGPGLYRRDVRRERSRQRRAAGGDHDLFPRRCRVHRPPRSALVRSTTIHASRDAHADAHGRPRAARIPDRPCVLDGDDAEDAGCTLHLFPVLTR